MGFLGNMELSALPLLVSGTGLARAHGLLNLSPTPIPTLRAQKTSTTPLGQSKFQPPPRGRFSHQVSSKSQFSNATILERLVGGSQAHP